MKTWLIGSAADCDLVVEQPTVSAHHCLLTQSTEGFSLRDLDSTNGTFVNGSRIASKVQIRPTDTVTLGTSTPLPWPPGIDSPLELVVRIGREPDNDVVLDYPMISGHHARITKTDAGAVIEDTGSMNGTYIGSFDQRVTRSAIQPSPETSVIRG